VRYAAKTPHDAAAGVNEPYALTLDDVVQACRCFCLAEEGKRKSLTARRMRRRQLKRSLREKFGVSFESWNRHRRQRNGNVLLLSVYQEITVNRRRQRSKLHFQFYHIAITTLRTDAF